MAKWKDNGSGKPNAVAYVYYSEVAGEETFVLGDIGQFDATLDQMIWSFDFSQIAERLIDMGKTELIPGMLVVNVFTYTGNITDEAGREGIIPDTSINIHVPAFAVETIDDIEQEAVLSDKGGSIGYSGRGYYFDGETVEFIVSENQGYKISFFGHKQGSSREVTLTKEDDRIYRVTSQFTRVVDVTLDVGDEGLAAELAARRLDSGKIDGSDLFAYEGGTEVTYYVPYNTDRSKFYTSYIYPDVANLMKDHGSLFIERYIDIAMNSDVGAYQSKEEIEAERNARSEKITEDDAYYVLWKKPVESAEITVKKLACDTVMISETDSDGNVTEQTPAPEIMCTGDVILGTSIQPVWTDENLQVINGSLEGKENLLLVFEMLPKFGYYIQDLNKIKVNGISPYVFAATIYSVPVEVAHDYQEVEGTAVAPSCESAGKAANQKCTKCEFIKTGETIEATGHDWGDWEITKPATYDEEGVETRICRKDNTHVETRPIGKLEKTDISGASVAKIANKAYTGKKITPAVSVTVDGVKLVKGTDYTLTYSNNLKVGKATVTITGKGAYSGTKKVTFQIVKAKQPMKITAKTATLKAGKAKTKKQVIKVSKVMTIKKAMGTKTFKKMSGPKKFSVNKKTGAITVMKGTGKGTYKIKIKVTAKGNTNYKSGSKTVTVKVKIK